MILFPVRVSYHIIINQEGSGERYIYIYHILFQDAMIKLLLPDPTKASPLIQHHVTMSVTVLDNTSLSCSKLCDHKSKCQEKLHYARSRREILDRVYHCRSFIQTLKKDHFLCTYKIVGAEDYKDQPDQFKLMIKRKTTIFQDLKYRMLVPRTLCPGDPIPTFLVPLILLIQIQAYGLFLPAASPVGTITLPKKHLYKPHSLRQSSQPNKDF